MREDNRELNGQLSLIRRRAFIGGAVSQLKTKRKAEAYGLFWRIHRLLEESFNMQASIPAVKEIPGHRKGNKARRLNELLKNEMYNSDLFVVILYTPYSNGVSYELSLAAQYVVPTIIVRRRGISLPETFLRDEVLLCAVLTFETSIEAENKLSTWLTDKVRWHSHTTNIEMLNRIGMARERARELLEQGPLRTLIEALSMTRHLSFHTIETESGIPSKYLSSMLKGRNKADIASFSPFGRALLSGLTDVQLAEHFILKDAEQDLRLKQLVAKVAVVEGWPFGDMVSFAVAQHPRWLTGMVRLPEPLALKEISSKHQQWVESQRGNGHGDETSLTREDYQKLWP